MGYFLGQYFLVTNILLTCACCNMSQCRQAARGVGHFLSQSHTVWMYFVQFRYRVQSDSVLLHRHSALCGLAK